MESEKIQRPAAENEEILQKAAELEAAVIAHMVQQKALGWQRAFDERQRRLIQNCRLYAVQDPAGLPGHNLMLIIYTMADLLDVAQERGFDIYA